MAWSQQSKVTQQQNDLEILTPDGQQILVGENEDEVLIYEEGFNNWENRAPREVIDYQNALEEGFEDWQGTALTDLVLEGSIIKDNEERTANIEAETGEELLIWWTNQGWRMREKIEA